MNFEDVHELVQQDIYAVASEMKTWHPAILGEMLRAVALAKTMRYPGTHPDYSAAVEHIRREKGS